MALILTDSGNGHFMGVLGQEAFMREPVRVKPARTDQSSRERSLAGSFP